MRLLSAPRGRRVLIAVPAYDGVSAGTAFSLAQVEGCDVTLLSGCCHVDDARNRLVADFLEGSSEELVFVDSDVRFSVPMLQRLLSYDADIVAISYPLKQNDGDFPCRLLPGLQFARADGLLEVEGVPAGFLRIRRRVLEQLAAKAPQIEMSGVPVIFERELHAGVRWGGDYVFCRKARAAGFKVFVDPEGAIEHAGEKIWHGTLGNQLRKAHGLPLAELSLLDLDDPQTFENLAAAWGNLPFAAEPQLVMAAARVGQTITGGAVLEFGCGLTTLALAKLNPQLTVHALEHDPAWISAMRFELERSGITNVEMHYAPLIGRFYAADQIPALPWRMVLLDGPPSLTGDRQRAFEVSVPPDAVWLVDDAERVQLPGWAWRVSGKRRQIALYVPPSLQEAA